MYQSANSYFCAGNLKHWDTFVTFKLWVLWSVFPLHIIFWGAVWMYVGNGNGGLYKGE